MSVNTMALEDVYQLLNSLHAQATGQTGIAATDLSSFQSVATATLQAGTDTVYQALMQTIGRTIFSSRNYSAKFNGMRADDTRWGGITRKISIADRDIEADQVYHPVDGGSVDQWKIKKSNTLETRYYGSDIYEDWYTTFEVQLINAFAGPGQLGSFVALQSQEMNNKWEQYRENLVRSMLSNFIGAKLDAGNGIVHLLTEYNTQTGLTLTAQDIYKEQYQAAFFRWVRARINQLARRMTERTRAYQIQITGKEITRHTPLDRQKMYLSADALDIIDTMVNTVTFHDEPLAYADVEGISYWQSFDNPTSVNVTPVYIDATGAVKTAAAAVSETDVFGVIFDEDAMMYNVKDYTVLTTELNKRGRYFNTFLSANIQLMSDFTEKGIVLLLD